MNTAQAVKELKRLYKEASEINVALVIAHDEGRMEDAKRFIDKLDTVTRAIYELTLWRVKGVQITLARAS
jgi:hypothetical protein